MKKYLIYHDVVQEAGLGNTLLCYNYALNMAAVNHQELIVSRCIAGHGLGNNFEFESFFGLDQHSDSWIRYFTNINCNESEIIEYSYTYSSRKQRSNFSESKLFFKEKYENTVSEKAKIFKNHNVSDKVNIAIHIRRGDMVGDEQSVKIYKDRILSDEWFKNALYKLIEIKKYNMKDLNINIYSELQPNGVYYNENGTPSDLRKTFDFDNCTFYLNVNMYECAYNMINADLFLGGYPKSIPMIISLYRDFFDRESYMDWHGLSYVRENNLRKTRCIAADGRID